MIAAAKSDAKRAEDDLRTLLKESASRFFPRLGDPLDPSLDFGTHRWLKLGREEAYSDWLAWIMERQKQAGDILALFEIPPKPTLLRTATVEREVSTPKGRLDLLIRLGAKSTLVVEVKTDSYPNADQLNRYLSWVRHQPGPLGVILLAREEPDDLPKDKDIQFCSWQRVAEVLRDWSSVWLREGKGIEAALTLAFCGAVEQNILGFGVEGLEALRTKLYIEGWMERAEHVEREA